MNCLIDVAKQYLKDDRIEFVCTDGYQWIQNYKGEKFDFIFADAMPGKYDLFDETISTSKNKVDFILLMICYHNQTGLQGMLIK